MNFSFPRFSVLTSLVSAFLCISTCYHALLAQDIQGQIDESCPQLTASEYDKWRGSSLGIRLDTKKDKFFIEQVMPHVSDSPFQVGDQVLEIGPVDLSESPLSDIGELLRATESGATITAKIIRDELEQTVSAKTYRQEFVDIAAIVERIQKNRIIKAHMDELGRSEELATMTSRMVAAVKKSKSPREAYEGINQVIDDIGVSHTAFVPQSTFNQLTGSTAGELGLALRRFDWNGQTGFFVIDIKPGTAAFGSDLKLGDRIEFINGVRIDDSRRLILAGEEQRHGVFAVEAELEETVRFEHRHTPHGPMMSTSLLATKTVSLADSVKASSRVIETNQKKFAYIRFWNLMQLAVNKELQSQLGEEFAECDALILDLRGRGGTISTVLAVDRTIAQMEIPVIGITDELTRSAKELLSHRIKLHEHVTVIGERTTGAVTAATFAKLPSGNVLMFPVMSSDALKSYTDGVILEGNGVEPDEQVDFHEPFCNGVDGLLKAAIDKAIKETKFD